MTNACIARSVTESCAAPASAQASPGVAPLEALEKLLGYTQKELALASATLNRFTWRAPAKAARRNVQFAEGDVNESSPDRKRVA